VTSSRKIKFMSRTPRSKPTRVDAPVRLGRSPATGQYVLKPVHKRGSVTADKLAEVVEKVITSRHR
jgi:hypothetical protein